ncbi:acetyltransferase [Photobacterium damselae subsp. damselae]|uniref:acetyltransferase n=1 Tax=Photobacterium damselae TaxID=38293 RepID=UPI001F46E4B7|nr:acetyltransferase [Photobacterium damselae]UJZ94570.1 acetyltransferase [Photobacterium damselae subsp. damselae]UJZ98553.1 acetyltransferase [Photobacterium damselae subsp. damselae]
MNDKATLPIVMIGGGGHASVLAEILLNQGRDIIAVISPEDISQRAVFEGITLLEKDEDILKFDKDKILLVNGIGMMPRSNLKRHINEYFLTLGYQFETVVADNALISSSAVIEPGVQILPSAVINTGAKIGSHTIINTGSLVEHDCEIGAYNHLAPRSLLCGQVKTGNNVFIGANATVINNISIGDNSVIGAGCTIRKKIDANVIAY